jgi:hypothetical protein
MRRRFNRVVFLICALVTLVVASASYAYVTMVCTHHSDGCVICKHFNNQGEYCGKTMLDCR